MHRIPPHSRARGGAQFILSRLSQNSVESYQVVGWLAKQPNKQRSSNPGRVHRDANVAVLCCRPRAQKQFNSETQQVHMFVCTAMGGLSNMYKHIQAHRTCICFARLVGAFRPAKSSTTATANADTLQTHQPMSTTKQSYHHAPSRLKFSFLGGKDKDRAISVSLSNRCCIRTLGDTRAASRHAPGLPSPCSLFQRGRRLIYFLNQQCAIFCLPSLCLGDNENIIIVHRPCLPNSRIS